MIDKMNFLHVYCTCLFSTIVACRYEYPLYKNFVISHTSFLRSQSGHTRFLHNFYLNYFLEIKLEMIKIEMIPEVYKNSKILTTNNGCQ